MLAINVIFHCSQHECPAIDIELYCMEMYEDRRGGEEGRGVRLVEGRMRVRLERKRKRGGKGKVSGERGK